MQRQGELQVQLVWEKRPDKSTNSTDKLKDDIRTDTNRDSTVDITGLSNSNDKNEWSADSGAIFLPDIGDTNRRCSNALLKGPAVSNEKFDKCNDAFDNSMRSEQFVAPLRTIPMPGLPNDASGRVSIKDPVQRNQAYVDGNSTFSTASLREHLVFGIDGSHAHCPDGWDDPVTITFDVQSCLDSLSDKVILRTHTHLYLVQQIIAVKGNEISEPWLVRFSKNFLTAVTESGLEGELYFFHDRDDIWAQDFMEPDAASLPSPDSPISLQIMICTSQNERVAGKQVFEYHHDTGIGAVQQLGGAREEIKSGGNIETIPAYEFSDTSWPAGRLILGNHGEQEHFMLLFF
ncbi:arginine deiminase type-3 [Pyrenophora seminiperda CCB06]|uniref:Arginine deiminase type-3 n=1 Tax=Pyrenophora seminiperda CCB06 TaxID=1302712 RepID=A0A3M7MAQ5_9PLEO|nr:arginine deiminase type-3 [Pyrenophora seminiperda CCB06]